MLGTGQKVYTYHLKSIVKQTFFFTSPPDFFKTMPKYAANLISFCNKLYDHINGLLSDLTVIFILPV